ncbi:hypothetical protein CsatB_008097 [Cannabis sativa]
MEKQAKYQDKILKFLPRAASVITFQNPPFSPNRDNRMMRSENASKQLKLAHGRGFSGPIISMIHDEARRKPKNGDETQDQDPTSPKISCMGQIKQSSKKKKKNKCEKVNNNVVMNNNKRVSSVVHQEAKPVTRSPREVKKQASAIKRIFMSSSSRKSNNASVDDKSTLPDRAPSLSQMKRFASGRSDPFSNFDWAAAQVTPLDSDHRNICYSDHEGGSDQDDEDEEIRIPFSAPMVVGEGVALQPRKEINLWKRRTMAPPRPLEIRAN